MAWAWLRHSANYENQTHQQEFIFDFLIHQKYRVETFEMDKEEHMLTLLFENAPNWLLSYHSCNSSDNLHWRAATVQQRLHRSIQVLRLQTRLFARGGGRDRLS